MDRGRLSLDNDAFVRWILRTRRRLCQFHVGRLIDTSSVFTILLALAVAVFWGQSALYFDVHTLHAGPLLREWLFLIACALLLTDAILVRLSGKPLYWPESGELVTLATAPIALGDIYLTVRTALLAIPVFFFAAFVGVALFLCSDFVRPSWQSAICAVLLTLLYGIAREGATWSQFHAGKSRTTMPMLIFFAFAIEVALLLFTYLYSAPMAILAVCLTLLAITGCAGAILRRTSRHQPIRWGAFGPYGEYKLTQWQALGIGDWSVLLTSHTESEERSGEASSVRLVVEKRNTLSAQQAIPSPIASVPFPYFTRFPLVPFTLAQLSRNKGPAKLIGGIAVAVIAIRAVPAAEQILLISMASALTALLLSASAIAERSAVPWFDLFPWSNARLQMQVAAIAALFVFPLIAFLAITCLPVQIHAKILDMVALGAIALTQVELASSAALNDARFSAEWVLLLSFVPWLGMMAGNVWLHLGALDWLVPVIVTLAVIVLRRKRWFALISALRSL